MKKIYRFFIYILASDSGTLYVGLTNNIYRRIEEHKTKANKKSFSSKYKCYKLVYFEEHRYVNNAINIEGVTKPVLLSTDDNDNIFIGSEQDGKITDVYYGNLEQSTIKWKKQILAKPVLSKHLYVNRKGEIYLNDILKGELTNLTINKPYTYEGEVIGIYDTGFMTMNKNKITKNPFNK